MEINGERNIVSKILEKALGEDNTSSEKYLLRFFASVLLFLLLVGYIDLIVCPT